MKPKEFKTFEEFWPFYVSQHLNRVNRALHFAGTNLAIIIMAHWFVTAPGIWLSYDGWYLVRVALILHLMIAPVAGYSLAWVGHFFFEKNKPATFQYPLWSLWGDFKMYDYMCTGRMGHEINRAQMKLVKKNKSA